MGSRIKLAGKKRRTALATLVAPAKAKSVFRSNFNGSVLTVFAVVIASFAQTSVLADRDLAGSNDVEPPGANTLQEWLETQTWWWMLKERSSPSAVLFDRPTLSQRYTEAVAQMAQLQTAKFEQALQPPSTWKSIGPAHIASNHCSYGAENSGRIVSLAIDPADPSHWLITADSGGIWDTTDAGGTWIPRTDDQSTLQLSSGTAAIAFASPLTKSRVVYATGLAGLLKSSDGGATWTLVENAIFAGRGAREFVVSPTNPDVVVAAVDILFGSDASYGIYRTTDGGFTWTQKLSHSASDLVSVAGDFTRQYAAIGELGYASNGIYRSTDSGQNWRRIAGPWDSHADRISLALAPSDSSVLYVAVEDNTNFSHALGIWQTSNAWDPTPTWEQLPDLPAKYNINFGQPLSVDPSNSSDLYAGGTYLFKYHNGQWTNIWACPPNGTHVDFWRLQWIGGDFVVTNDGGIFRSSDKGATYRSRNGDLPIAEFYPGAAIHPTNPNVALGGTQDNATAIYGGSRIWQQFATGDGMSNAISAVNPDTQWIASSYGMRIYRTRDAGASWKRIDQGIQPNCRQFLTRLTSCPAGDVLLTGTCAHIWRSDNAFSADVPTWNVNSPNIGEDPQAIAFAPSDMTCGTYAIGAPSGKVWATTNAGTTWSQIGPANQLPTRVVTALAFDPQNARKLYATLSGFNAEGGHPGHVYVCSDITSANPTWLDISPPLDSPHNAIAVDPQIPDDLYVGTDVGMLVSTDAGASWAAVPSNQIPRVIVNDIKINRTTNLVIAFTYGRGAYSRTLPSADGLSGSIPSHRELPYVAGQSDRLFRTRPWYLGLGILGTLVITGSYAGRNRKRTQRNKL